MSEETSVKTPGFFIPIAIALVGVVLGAIAIYVAVSGNGQRDDLTKKLTEATDKVSLYDQRIATLEEQVRIASESVNTLSMKAQKTDEGIASLVQQTQAIVNKLGEEIASLKSGRPAAKAAKADKADKADAAAEPAADAAAEPGVYVVKAGDSFSKIARALNVSVEDIEKANPNVNSARLRIGQKLNVPTKQ